MTDNAVLLDWLAFVARWAHVAAAMAWFGAAFYFRARELRQKWTADLPPSAIGAEWEFHGGGYIQATKFRGLPAAAPEQAPLFKWESYFTWITGFLLLGLVYYAESRLFLIDESKLPLTPATAIALSVLSLVGGWLAYDRICIWMERLPNVWVDALMLVLMIAASWGYARVFTGRAAMLHLGALLATIMVGNVFFVVMRNSKRAMAALQAGRDPDPKDRRRIGQRGRHTRFLHLPIIFLMASVHSPLVFGTEHAWILAPIVLAIGIILGTAFEAWHRDHRMPAWPWVGAAILTIVMMWITSAGRPVAPAVPGTAARLIESPQYSEVERIVSGRCAMCHGVAPDWPGIELAPRHVLLDDPARVAASARQIYLQAGLSTAMPPGNVTYMTEAERALIVNWYRGAVQ